MSAATGRVTAFVAVGQVDYEYMDILGVFLQFEDALQRCRDREHQPGADYGFDRYWIQEWPLGAPEASNTHAVTLAELVAKAASR